MNPFYKKLKPLNAIGTKNILGQKFDVLVFDGKIENLSFWDQKNEQRFENLANLKTRKNSSN